jgi:hypothetical protein
MNKLYTYAIIVLVEVIRLSGVFLYIFHMLNLTELKGDTLTWESSSNGRALA